MARFAGGAKRRDMKLRFDLIPFEFLESVAGVLSSGAVRHGAAARRDGRPAGLGAPPSARQIKGW